MKVIIPVLCVLLGGSGSFAYTLTEIHRAYTTNTSLVETPGTFADAMNLLARNENRGDLVAAKNILIKLLSDGKATKNQRSALVAGIAYADDLLDADALKSSRM